MGETSIRRPRYAELRQYGASHARPMAGRPLSCHRSEPIPHILHLGVIYAVFGIGFLLASLLG